MILVSEAGWSIGVRPEKRVNSLSPARVRSAMRSALIVMLSTVACSVMPGRAALLRAVPLPHPRHGHRVEPLHGGLLAFGGSAARAGEDARVQTFWLAPGAANWERRADMVRGGSFFASVVIDGAVFAISAGVERYDFSADRWVDVMATPELPRSHHGAVALGRRILVLGGHPLASSGCLLVDVDRGSVERAAPPPGFEPGDHLHHVAVLDGAVHVVGGVGGQPFGPHARHSVRGPAGDWRTLPAPPAPTWAKFGGSVVLGDALWVTDESSTMSWRATAGWQFGPAREPFVAMPAAVAVGGEMWLLGGMVPSEPAARLEILEPAAGAWRRIE